MPAQAERRDLGPMPQIYYCCKKTCNQTTLISSYQTSLSLHPIFSLSTKYEFFCLTVDLDIADGTRRGQLGEQGAPLGLSSCRDLFLAMEYLCLF